jgi:protein-disulfide isomerase
MLFSSAALANEVSKEEAAKAQAEKAAATTLATTPESADKAKAEAADYKAAAQAQIQNYENFVKQVADFEKSEKFNPKLLEENLPLDLNLGDANAPVKFVEYASLGCIHCKEFHTNIFYKLKKDFIDTGKVQFKFRHYPLNAPALKAAMVMGCVAEADRLAYIGAMFDSQAQWAYSKSEADLKDKLKTMSKIVGVESEAFEKCYNDETVQTQIVANMKRSYDELMITSTPGLFINGKRFLDSREYETVAKHIKNLIAEAEAAKN